MESEQNQPTVPGASADEAAKAAASNGPAAGAKATESASDPQTESEALRAELAAMKDRYLRSQAELENYRKRVQREISDLHRYASLGLLRDLLPVLDNIDRAIQAAEKTRDPDTLLQGFKMVGQQLQRLLQQHHCERIEALHKPFDPRHHEAIMQVPNAEHPDQTVVQEALPGYLLHDRVVRPSQVVVSAKPAEQ